MPQLVLLATAMQSSAEDRFWPSAPDRYVSFPMLPNAAPRRNADLKVLTTASIFTADHRRNYRKRV